MTFHNAEPATPKHFQNGFNFLEFDAYLFDIDGTLLNSRDGVHYNAFHSALRATYGCDLKIDDVPVHGNTDIGILRAVVRRHGITDAIFDEHLHSALEHMREQAEKNFGDMHPELCPSIRELLELLHSKGKLLGVVSGNLESIGWRKLEAAGVREFFSIGSFSDRNELREGIYRHGVEQAQQRLGPEVRICFVGDTPADVAAAKALGKPILAVGTGIFPVEELNALGPNACVTCCTELL